MFYPGEGKKGQPKAGDYVAEQTRAEAAASPHRRTAVDLARADKWEGQALGLSRGNGANAAYCKFGDSMNAKTDRALLNRWHRRKNYSAIQWSVPSQPRNH